MTIYLVRHGLAMAGVEDLDPGLADLGREQARATADALRQRRVARLVVSPLRRTRETAVPIAQTLALEPELRDEVGEIPDAPMESDARWAMKEPFKDGRWSDQSERVRRWRQRVIDALLEIGLGAAAADGDLVVVTHFMAISVVLGAAMGDDLLIQGDLANCSITTIEVGRGGFRWVLSGDTRHLRPDLITGLGFAIWSAQPPKARRRHTELP